jgi:RNA polymerase sigma-70 factor (ECF subfamily)
LKYNSKLAGSNAEAFSELFRSLYQRVYQYLRYRCNSDQTAEDLTVQVFERVLLNLQRYQPGDTPIETWIFTIASNCFRDWYRKNKRVSWFSLDLFKQHPSRQPSPEDQAVHNEHHRELNQSLQNLNDRERNIIAWRFGARLTNRQIASLNHLSEQNVAVILYRALKKLKCDLTSGQEVKNV